MANDWDSGKDKAIQELLKDGKTSKFNDNKNSNNKGGGGAPWWWILVLIVAGLFIAGGQ